MMTSFSFEPLLRSLSIPKSMPMPTRAEVRPPAEANGGNPFVATLYGACGKSFVHCSGLSPEDAVRGALLGFLAVVARMTNADVAEEQARVVRLTLN